MVDMVVRIVIWLETLGFGYVGDKVDAIFIFTTYRSSNEEVRERGLEFNYSKANIQILKPTVFHSYLAIGWLSTLRLNHKVGNGVNEQKGSRYVDERSYTSFGSLLGVKRMNHKINVIQYQCILTFIRQSLITQHLVS